MIKHSFLLPYLHFSYLPFCLYHLFKAECRKKIYAEGKKKTTQTPTLKQLLSTAVRKSTNQMTSRGKVRSGICISKRNSEPVKPVTLPGKGWSTDEAAAAAAPAHVNSIMWMHSPCEKQPQHSLRALCIPGSALKRILLLQLMQEILPKDSIPYAENVYIPSWQERKILGCSQTSHQFQHFQHLLRNF